MHSLMKRSNNEQFYLKSFACVFNSFLLRSEIYQLDIYAAVFFECGIWAVLFDCGSLYVKQKENNYT